MARTQAALNKQAAVEKYVSVLYVKKHGQLDWYGPKSEDEQKDFERLKKIAWKLSAKDLFYMARIVSGDG